MQEYLLKRAPQRILSGTRSFWSSVPMGPRDHILGIKEKYKMDPNPRKVDLIVGAYRDSDGNPYVFKSVRKAEDIIRSKNLDKEYLPMLGSAEFCKLSAELAYGEVYKDNLFATCQSISGTGSLFILACYLNKFGPERKCIYVSDPTWSNHVPLFKMAGLEAKHYRYYNKSTNSVDFNGMREDLEDAPDDSIILLQAIAHNPTGMDLSKEQLREILDIIKRKHHITLVDLAYQGFATGNLDDDAFLARELCRMKLPFTLAQSYSKNMGLYGERIGMASVIVDSEEELSRVESQLKLIARHTYSNPPISGARIVKTILSSEELKAEWIEELKMVQKRIQQMRHSLRTLLEDKYKSPLSWEHITNQKGMFCYTGLSNKQVEALVNKYSIHLTSTGRISVAGVVDGNLDYIASSIHAVTTSDNI